MAMVRFGVIGIGYGGAVLIPAIRRDARAEVVALSASTLANAQKVATELQVPRAYGCWRDMLESEGLDAVAVAVPPHLQPEILICALTLGLAVFAEKPLSVCLAEADRIIVAQRLNSNPNAVDFNFTGIAAFVMARERLALGTLGQLRHVVVNWQVENYANRNRLVGWKTDSTSGGGTLFSFVSHTLHYLEWLTGHRIVSIAARLWSIPGDVRRGDATVALQLDFGSGAAAMVAVSAAAALGTGHEVALYGDDGTVILRNTTSDYMQGFELLTGTRAQRALEAVALPAPEKSGDGRILATGQLISKLIDCIHKGTVMECDLRAGRRVQVLIESAMKSNRTRRWVNIETGEEAIEK